MRGLVIVFVAMVALTSPEQAAAQSSDGPSKVAASVAKQAKKAKPKAEMKPKARNAKGAVKPPGKGASSRPAGAQGTSVDQKKPKAKAKKSKPV